MLACFSALLLRLLHAAFRSGDAEVQQTSRQADARLEVQRRDAMGPIMERTAGQRQHLEFVPVAHQSSESQAASSSPTSLGGTHSAPAIRDSRFAAATMGSMLTRSTPSFAGSMQGQPNRTLAV